MNQCRCESNAEPDRWLRLYMGMPPHRQAMYADASITKHPIIAIPIRAPAHALTFPADDDMHALYAPFALAPWELCWRRTWI